MDKSVETKQAKPRERQMPLTRAQLWLAEIIPISAYVHHDPRASGEPVCSITMSGSAFADAVRRVAVACAPGEYSGSEREGMAGIRSDLRRSGRARLVATDGFRCALADFPTEGDAGELPPGEGILPAHPMREAARLVTETGAETVEMRLSEYGQVWLHVAGEVLAGRSISALYPDYRGAWPEGFEREFRVPREPLKEALRRLGPRVRRERRPWVELAFSGEELTVRVEDKRLKRGEMTERLPVEAERDEEFRISFNPTELLEVLEVVDAEEVILSANEPQRFAQLAAATEEGEPGFRYLLKPERSAPADEPSA